MQIYHGIISPSDPNEEAKVRASGQLWGKPKRAIKGNWKSKFRAFLGPLPDSLIGYSFTSEVPPHGEEIYGGRDGVYWLKDEEGVFDVPNHRAYVGIMVEVLDI